jgi:hypothetical protein
MAKLSQQTLSPSPFITYRDPETGLWLIENLRDSENYNHACDSISGDHRLQQNLSNSTSTEEKIIPR